MLGRRVADILQKSEVVHHLTDMELDIADHAAVRSVMTSFAPTHVINCAAYTAVDKAEEEEALATRVNGDGPACLAQACLASGASLVHFSTDYIFDGIDHGPYPEAYPTFPQNAYGRSKLVGEQRIMEAFVSSVPQDSSRWYTLRTSWLFGSGPSSFVANMWKLMSEREELRVVNDQRGRPTFVDDLAHAALELSGCGKSPQAPSGTWHFANQGEATWFELAVATREVLEQYGESLTVRRILPVGTNEFPRPAPRPAYSVLSTHKLESFGISPRPWRAALEAFVIQAIEARRT
jgi:dTDP-4-dehydrorhamnose reductase